MFHSSSDFWGTSGALISETATDPTNTDVSTRDTLSIMSRLSRRDTSDPSLITLSHSLCSGCTSPRQAASSIWYWVREFLTFRRHEEIVLDVLGPYHAGIESQLLISPADVLKMPAPQGDCAIYSMLAASLLLLCGLPAWFRVTASDAEEPWRWSHVYPVTNVGESRDWAMDIIPSSKYPGWETKQKFNQMDWPI